MSAERGVSAFVDEARAFLDAHAERRETTRPFEWGVGSDAVAMFDEHGGPDAAAELRAARRWRARKYDAGFGWITGSPRYGGRGLSHAHQRAFDDLEADYDVPSESWFTIGLGMVAPTIAAHGSEAARDAYVSSLFRGDVIGCQLFSEPGAGSDLAAMTTRAERDGDDWVITGQKVWTSGAQYSDIGEVIARTDASLPKHRGLTGFIIDMRDPAVEVRPLRQMTGGSSFNEVFIDGLRVRDDHRLGAVNEGWGVAITTLMNERAAIGSGDHGGTGIAGRVVELARARAMTDDPVTRQMLADLIIHQRVAALNGRRSMATINAGGTPGPEMSTAKLAGSMNMRRLSSVAARLLGASLVADSGEWGTYSWSKLMLGAPGGRLAGGTDEVMRNIIGERVLGLPKEPAVDRGLPFTTAERSPER